MASRVIGWWKNYGTLRRFNERTCYRQTTTHARELSRCRSKRRPTAVTLRTLGQKASTSVMSLNVTDRLTKSVDRCRLDIPDSTKFETRIRRIENEPKWLSGSLRLIRKVLKWAHAESSIVRPIFSHFIADGRVWYDFDRRLKKWQNLGICWSEVPAKPEFLTCTERIPRFPELTPFPAASRTDMAEYWHECGWWWAS